MIVGVLLINKVSMIKRVSVILFLLVSTSLFSQNWLANIDEAIVLAKDQKQKIVLVFSGSDWCAPCIKLEKEIWNSNEFIEFSKSNFVLLRADFPRRKNNALPQEQQEHNNKLAEMYNRNGYFPFVVVLDKDGNVLGETGYRKTSPSDYIKQLQSFK